MSDLFKINVVYSTSHWVVPKFVISILIILGILVVIVEGMARKKKGESFFVKPQRLLIQNYDKLKFWGTLVLFILYILSMEIIGFLAASIIFIFLFNVLFCGTFEKKSLAISAIISVIASVGIWYVFGVVFNITLPTSMF